MPNQAIASLKELVPTRQWTGEGNINLFARPHIKNPDGSISTVRSMSFGEDGQEILIPTATQQGILSNEEAIQEYHKTGAHLGKFRSPEEATNYAQRLHNDMANGIYDVPLVTSRQIANPQATQVAIQNLLRIKR